MRYPTVEEMKQIVLMTQKTMDEVADGVVGWRTLVRMRETAKEIPVTDDIINYTMRLVSSTQPFFAGGGRDRRADDPFGREPARRAGAHHLREGARHGIRPASTSATRLYRRAGLRLVAPRVKLSYEAYGRARHAGRGHRQAVDDMKKAQITAHCGREKHADTGRRAFLDALETLEITAADEERQLQHGARRSPRLWLLAGVCRLPRSMCRATDLRGVDWNAAARFD